MPAEAATEASFLLAAAASDQVMNWFVPVGVVDSTVTPLPETVAPPAMNASLSTCSTFRLTAAPTAVFDLRPPAAPIAFAVAFVVLFAVTETAPVELTVTVPSICAVFVSRAQLTATEAAMFVPPLLLSPASLLDDELAVLVSELELGIEPSVLPVVFGLLPTWSFDWSSAFLPESDDSPDELDVESASVDCVVVAVTASDPTVRFRFSSATVFVSMTFTATAAPIAT